MGALQIKLADETLTHGIIMQLQNTGLFDGVDVVSAKVWETIMEPEQYQAMRESYKLKDNENFIVRITTTGRGNYVEFYETEEQAIERFEHIKSLIGSEV